MLMPGIIPWEIIWYLLHGKVVGKAVNLAMVCICNCDYRARQATREGM